MNIGGVANLSTQFALRRSQMSEDEKRPLGLELGRLITGRLAGTAGAALALTCAELHGVNTKITGSIARKIPFLDKIHIEGTSLSALFASDLIQSIGAIGPNILAQQLYDRVASDCQQYKAR
jgi:hypothetical protein